MGLGGFAGTIAIPTRHLDSFNLFKRLAKTKYHHLRDPFVFTFQQSMHLITKSNSYRLFNHRVMFVFRAGLRTRLITQNNCLCMRIIFHESLCDPQFYQQH